MIEHSGQLNEYRMYIDGNWVYARSDDVMSSLDPSNGRPWYTVPAAGPDDVDSAVGAARRALEGPWSRWTGTERARALRRLADLVESRSQHLASLETRDNGKLLRETTGQLESIPEALHYFAGWADKLTGETIPTEKPTSFVYTVREPAGVIAAIVPWNSPLMLTIFKLGPALAAGCTVVVKPSEHTSATALELAGLTEEAGIPPGVVNVVTGLGADAGRPLVRHPGIDKISFTGSSATGSQIIQESAPNVTGLMLELGGKSANIVFEDADVDLAVGGVLAGIFAAAGQTCVAGSRLLVHEKVHDDFVAAVGEKAGQLVIGDPSADSTQLGPLAFEAQMDKVLEYVGIASEQGARVSVGGSRVSEGELADGYYVQPTVLTGVDNGMRVAREEIFGPVLAVIPFNDESDAVAIANDSEFGLAAGIWTADYRRIHRVSSALDVGTVWVNSYRMSSHTVPFGGRKGSGLGYQNGTEGLDEFLRTKAVWLELGEESRDPFRLG